MPHVSFVLVHELVCCCGPVGRHWFPEVAGFASPCSTPWDERGAVSTSIGGLYRGARFLVRVVGPFCIGDRAPESAVCSGWRHSRMEVGWLAERPDSGARMVHNVACAYNTNAHA